MSGSGNLVVACSVDGELAFWKRLDDNWEGNIERCSTSGGSARGADGRGPEIREFLFLLEDESASIILFGKSAGYEVWDVEAAELRLSHELPEISAISRVALSLGENHRSASKNTFLIGGCDRQGNNFVAEYSIDKKLEETGKCFIESRSFSLCSVWFVGESGERRDVVGCLNGYILLLDANVFSIGAGRLESDAVWEAVGKASLWINWT